MNSVRRIGLAALSLVGVLAIGEAQAQATIDGTDPEAIVNIVRGYGAARLESAADGTPMIRGRIEGTGFAVYFYGCDDSDQNCRSIGLWASWEAAEPVTVEDVNAWNREKRFGRAYIDGEGDPVLEMDVNLFGSVSADNFDDTVDWWRIIMADFQSNVVEAAGMAATEGEESGAEAENPDNRSSSDAAE